MSEEQLSALLAKHREDTGLREKLQNAADLDEAEAYVSAAGFDVTKEDWMKYQSQSEAALSDTELEYVVGGRASTGKECPNPDKSQGPGMNSCSSGGGSVAC